MYLPQLSMGYDSLPIHDLQAQLQVLTEAKVQREANERMLKKLLGKARYLVGLVQETPSDAARWQKVAEVLGGLDVLGANVTTIIFFI